MKTKEELLQMLQNRLKALQEGTIKITDPIRAARMRIELSLLRDILGEDLPQEYLRPIKEQTWD